MDLIKQEDLYFGRHGVVAKLQSSIIMKLAALDRVNKFYREVSVRGGDAPTEILTHLQVSCESTQFDLKNVPVSGSAIVIANHPTGALDGVLLMKLLSGVRPDVKFMGNFLLSKIGILEKYFISVDPFDSQGARNVSGIRASLEHLNQGGLLVIFPAGEVSTWQSGFCDVKDKSWDKSVMRFIRKANVPVIPLFINAKNSRLFHLMGKLHPMLRTAMLPREFLNKRGQKIEIRIGSAFSPKRAEELVDLDLYTRFLRANVYYLKPTHMRARKVRKQERKASKVVISSVVSATDAEVLSAELDSIRKDRLLIQYGSFDVFLSPPGDIPNMMREIGRLREITFREIGEGTNKEIDTDYFDTHYHQLFIWDNAAQKLVGAYRMGLGDEVVKEYGLKGFYTNTLFKMSPEMSDTMSKTIELGRSFIVSEYQRKPVSLLLLWKGILYILLKYEQFRYLMGPVTISGEFKDSSKLIIASYIKEYHLDKHNAKYITPTTGFKTTSKIDVSLIKGIESIELINKLVCDIERNEFSIPVLIRKYLQLNSGVLGFNTDHEFCDAVDALMLLDLKKVPEDIILMLSKEITDIDVTARFKHIVD